MVVLTKQELQFRQFETFASISSRVHRRHPAAPLLVTLVYLIIVTSYPPAAVINLIPFILFPLLLSRFAHIPLLPLLRSTLKVLPLLIIIGILHPVLDTTPVPWGTGTISRGWLVFASILLKGFLTIMASFLMISILGFAGLEGALKSLGIPPLFYMLVTTMYRYIMLLLEELYRVLRAYELRSGHKPNIDPTAWGSLPGGILIRTYEQGLRIQHAMELRGYNPHIPLGSTKAWTVGDTLFTVSWTAFFIAEKYFHFSAHIGTLFLHLVEQFHG